MVRRILQCPDQEIATHSYSNYYCLEPGQTDDQFRADLRDATAQLREWNIDCRSLVYPRHQFERSHLETFAAEGISAFRENEMNWVTIQRNGGAHCLHRRQAAR